MKTALFPKDEGEERGELEMRARKGFGRKDRVDAPPVPSSAYAEEQTGRLRAPVIGTLGLGLISKVPEK